MKIDMMYNEYNEPIAPLINTDVDDDEKDGLRETSPIQTVNENWTWSDLVNVWEKMQDLPKS
jgi:hypothetical protein